MRAVPDAIGGMTVKVCLRCDWLGETKEPACPLCGVPLYVLGARPHVAPARNDREAKNGRSSPANAPVPEPLPFPAEPRPSPSITTSSAGAFVVSVLVLIVALNAWLTSDRGVSNTSELPDTNLDDWFVPPISQLELPAPPAGVGPVVNLPGVNSCSPRCRRELTVGGVPLSFRVPARGWEAFGDISVNKSIAGPQGAEAIIYWTTIPGDYASPCIDVLGLVFPPRTVAGLAAAVADAPGIELLAGPSNVIVGEHPAKYLEVVVREDLGCDPGYFFIWHDVEGGALWPATEVGHTISVWLVDFRKTPIFIAAVTSEQATGPLYREIGRIVRSIRFEAPPGS